MSKSLKEECEFWARVWEAGVRHRSFDGHELNHPLFCSVVASMKIMMITLYARMGIHRYNMIQGMNLQLSCIAKYNYRPKVVYSTYHITLVAKDPAAGGSLVTFQTRVVVEGFEIKKLSCNIARPKPGPQENPVRLRPLDLEPVDDFYKDSLPEWPSEDAFNDNKRYYVVKKSELRNYDWIRLYMELAFLKANMRLKNPNLSKFMIVKVAVETKENLEPPSGET